MPKLGGRRKGLNASSVFCNPNLSESIFAHEVSLFAIRPVWPCEIFKAISIFNLKGLILHALEPLPIIQGFT